MMFNNLLWIYLNIIFDRREKKGKYQTPFFQAAIFVIFILMEKHFPIFYFMGFFVSYKYKYLCKEKKETLMRENVALYMGESFYVFPTFSSSFMYCIKCLGLNIDEKALNLGDLLVFILFTFNGSKVFSSF